MTDEVFTDKRLLGALDYIDERFIAEVTESYTFEAPGEYKRDKKTVFKAYRQFAALAACLLLLSAAFPVLNYAVQRFGTGIWEGNAGAGTSEIEMPTPTETQALNTEPEMTQVLETEPAETQAAVIDSGFDKALERYADMSAEEIYADVLKGGWVVIGEDNSDFVAGKELWHDFFEKSQKGEPVVVLVAKYSPNYSRDDIKEPVFVLKEIVYNGDLFYQKTIFSLTNEIDSQGEYRYLKSEGVEYVANGKPIYNEAYYLTNDSTWTWRDGLTEMFSQDAPSDRSFWKENHVLFTFSVNINDEKGD